MSSSERLTIAIQKSGRLSQESLDLLTACGVRFSTHDAQLMVHSSSHAVDLLRVRDDDIPGLIMDGVVDIGLVGDNVLEEESLERRIKQQNCTYLSLRRLDFGYCRLSLALPTEQDISGLNQLDDLRIATTYPRLLEQFMVSQGIKVRCIVLTGSVEVAPRAGLADAVCDLVSTGATLEANGLREHQVIFRSQARLIQRQQPLSAPRQQLLDKLLARIDGVQQARESKYIMLHAPKNRLKDVEAILPGAERPTIIPLADNDSRVALHMVSTENLFWETMEELKSLECSSILVLPIEKMMG